MMRGLILAMLGAVEKPTQTALRTGAKSTLRAEHRSRETGEVHLHFWQISVWTDRQVDAVMLKKQLDNWVSRFEGKCLPDRIAWGEDMAGEIMDCLTDHSGYFGYIANIDRVEIYRHNEGLYAEKIR
jgi:hypothetical protein